MVMDVRNLICIDKFKKDKINWIKFKFKLSNEDAEDIYSDAIIKLLELPIEVIEEINKKGIGASYLQKIIRNLCIDLKRKDTWRELKQNEHNEENYIYECEEAPPESPPNPFMDCHTFEEASYITWVIRNLTPNQQLSFLKKYFNVNLSVVDRVNLVRIRKNIAKYVNENKGFSVYIDA